MTLKDAKPGMTVRVESLEPSDLKQRLMSLGVIKGTVVKVLRSAPLGDPMAISLRSYSLSLRLADAEKIKVQMV
jgi:Fe2+ transport system protein A